MSTTGPRTQVRRVPEKQSHDPDALWQILAAGRIAHVAIVEGEQPYVLPVAYAPWRGGIVLHGSSASRLFKRLAAGAPTSATVTLLDGLVYARSAFESSMEYRSAMLFGTAVRVVGDDKTEALQALTEHLLPGRWEHIRHPSVQEDKATSVLHLLPAAWSVKIGAGFADEVAADQEERAHIWAGRVALTETTGPAVPDPTSASRGTALPASIARQLGTTT